MKRSMLLDHLAYVERHIRDGERHLLHQREIVAELELHGRGHSRTTQIAKDILATFEMSQSVHLNDRAHLRLCAAKEVGQFRRHVFHVRCAEGIGGCIGLHSGA